MAVILDIIKTEIFYCIPCVVPKKNILAWGNCPEPI